MANPPDESAPLPSTGRTSKPVPPFVAPRTPDAPQPSDRSTPLATPATPQRRSTPLFVPPASLPPEEPPSATAPVEAPPPAAVAPAAPAAIPPLPAPAAPPRETKGFVLEDLEQPEISLRASGKSPAEGGSDIQVIAYDDANASLQSNSVEGQKLNVDGFELETTELSIEPSRNPTPDADLAIESFWAAEAFTPSARPSSKLSRETPRSITPPFGQPPADAPPPRRSALDALRVEEMMPVRLPTPPSVRIVTPHSVRGSTSVSGEIAAVPVVARTPAALEALKELEPWALAPPVPANAVAAVADALERVARRIRNGEVRVRADFPVPTDEHALSAALQALGRAPRR